MTHLWAAASGDFVIRLVAIAAVTLLVVSGCAAGAPTSVQSDSASVLPSPTTATNTASAGSSEIASDVVGYWHRAQTCEELLATFEAAGLAESHTGWLQGNFFGGEPGPTSGALCAGAEGALEHSHWFTPEGEFGSHDQDGEEVDFGDYVVVDADTLSFPSHASEFRYDGDLLVDYAIQADMVTFEVALPDPCEAACQDAYAWALSAFSSGPWATGDVP